MGFSSEINHKLGFLEELRSIALLGLNYSKDSFDRERYERLLDLAALQYAQLGGLSTEECRKRLCEDLGHVTPKVGVNGAIFSSEGELLLSKRSDDNSWELPGGWAEPGESPREAIVREVQEELSVEIEAGPVIEIFHRVPGMYGYPFTTYHPLFVCKLLRGQLRPNHEVAQARFCSVDEVSDWHRDHGEMAQVAVKYWRSGKGERVPLSS